MRFPRYADHAEFRATSPWNQKSAMLNQRGPIASGIRCLTVAASFDGGGGAAITILAYDSALHG